MTGQDSDEVSRLGLALSDLVRAALDEDIGSGDRTSEAIITERHESTAVIVAKARIVLSGADAVREVFRQVDPGLHLAMGADDGEVVEAGQTVLSVSGRTRSILRGERVALNFLAHLSGIATLTAKFVERVDGFSTRVLDTRKTTPGWRVLEKVAVRHGGGTNHRFGLDDMILIKDNHIAAAGGISAAVRSARTAHGDGLPIEVEVSNLEELQEVLALNTDRVLLDNMSLDMLRESVQLCRQVTAGAPTLEASGNMTLETIREVAMTGVDFVSVGALTHSAPAADFSLRLRGSS